jgi:hypothetical protein
MIQTLEFSCFQSQVPLVLSYAETLLKGPEPDTRALASFVSRRVAVREPVAQRGSEKDRYLAFLREQGNATVNDQFFLSILLIGLF